MTAVDLAVVVAGFARGDSTPEQLHAAFLAATVYAPRPVRPQRPGVLAAGPVGAGHVPVFTSLDELGRWAGECDWFATTGADLLDLLPPGYGLLVDPAGDHPVGLAAWSLRRGLPRPDLGA